VTPGALSSTDGVRLLFAGNPLPMWLYDLETRAILEVNAAAVAHYGYSRDEFLRMRLDDIRTDEDAGRHRLRDGRIIEVDTASQAVDFGGRPAALQVVHDLTARRDSERALERSEARKAAIVESALDCVITMDAEGRVVEFNPAAERTFGYCQSDVVGRPLADLIIPPDLRQKHRDGLARHRETGHHTVLGRRLEMRAMRADGAQFPVELAITQIQGSGGQALYTGFVRDISDRKRAEEDLRLLNAELEERVRLRTTELQAAADELEAFSYSVSHDLRAPLRSIDGFSQALAEDAGSSLPAEAKGHLDRIRAATQRMAHLIDDLLSLSRVARSPMTRERVDVTDLAGRILAELGRQSPDRMVRLTIAPAMMASGDPRLLRVALENLLENAWKFTTGREDARIEVGQTKGGSAPVFFVRDNGAGFDPAYVGKLFTPFQRLHASSEFPGTGIGLATVRRIMHRHGGRVWADGQPGQGACFYFTLE
jgi:PAS domain S-box-containing protein